MRWFWRTFKADLDLIQKQKEREKFKLLAQNYYLRARMNGDVIKKTGELIPRESA